MSGATATSTESCAVCGTTLEYLSAATTLRCSVCGREHRGHVVCPHGHYVCEDCHGAGFRDRLPALLDAIGSASPYDIAEYLMAQGDLPMLGCEHAHVAAGALMRALENAGVPGVTAAHRAEVLERTTRQAISAYCGLSGVCGVVPALGACYSVLVGGQCGKGPETRAAMTLASRLAGATAEEADPGCCKAYVRRGLREAAAFLEEQLGITLEPPQPAVCIDVDRHPHGCRGAECAWHPEHEESMVNSSEPPGPANGPASSPANGPASSPASSPASGPAGDSAGDPAGGPAPTTGPAAKTRYDEFFELAYSEGALDRKTKILVALGASLAAGCVPWTSYCLSVGRRLGVTDEETDEVLHTAMTVGATRMQVLLTQEQAKLEGAYGAPAAGAAGGPAPQASQEGAAARAFSAAEVVEQAEGGWTGWGPDDAGAASQEDRTTGTTSPPAPLPATGSTWT